MLRNAPVPLCPQLGNSNEQRDPTWGQWGSKWHMALLQGQLPLKQLLPRGPGAQICQLFQFSKRSCKSNLICKNFKCWQLISLNCKHSEPHKTLHLQQYLIVSQYFIGILEIDRRRNKLFYPWVLFRYQKGNMDGVSPYAETIFVKMRRNKHGPLLGYLSKYNCILIIWG